MQKYDVIENGIANKDIKALREAIGSICYTNRDFSDGEFFEVIKYVEAKGIVIRDDKLVGSPTISSQKKTFSDEDFAKAVFELKKNFCDERINDVKTIGESLYGNDKGKNKNNNLSSHNVNAPNLSNNQAGKSPNQVGHQQKKMAMKSLVLVAIIVILVIVCLLVLN